MPPCTAHSVNTFVSSPSALTPEFLARLLLAPDQQAEPGSHFIADSIHKHGDTVRVLPELRPRVSLA